MSATAEKEQSVMPSERLEQLRELLAIQERMNRLFEDVMRQQTHEEVNAVWMPAVDIFETEHDLVVKAELPEVKREDIQVLVEHDKLIMRGERRLPAELKRDQFHRVERIYGTFARNFTLPHNIDQDKIVAEYKQGVLTITMPKAGQLRNQKITVKIG
jgi:HSP20 family protein